MGPGPGWGASQASLPGIAGAPSSSLVHPRVSTRISTPAKCGPARIWQNKHPFRRKLIVVRPDKKPSREKCVFCQMRAGPHLAGVLILVLTLVRTRRGDGGQTPAMALPGALSPSGPGLGAQEERKPFVLQHLSRPH